MVEDKKKVVMIVIIVACLGLAAVIAVINLGGGDSGGGGGVAAAGPLPTLCVNRDCGHIFEMTRDEHRQQMRERGRMMGRGGPPAFTCPQCGEESAYQANKCSKCNTVFIADYTSGDFADRCPECSYSAIEERRATKE